MIATEELEKVSRAFVPLFHLKDPHAMLAPIRNEEGVKFSVFLVCIHSVEITEI